MSEGFGCAGEGCRICDDRIPDMADWDSPLDICFCCGHVHDKPFKTEVKAHDCQGDERYGCEEKDCDTLAKNEAFGKKGSVKP